MKKSKARKWAEDRRELCQRISKLHSYLREMKIKYAPQNIEDSDWSPLFKLAVDDFETVDYYYELFILELTDEEQKKIYEELYNSDAEKPVRWLKFMEELLNPDDILTIQEYMGYMLLPTTKAQKMMLIIGKGGEGKSRIGLVLREQYEQGEQTF